MRTYEGEVQEILLSGGKRAARLHCPPQAIPAPGKYLLAEDGSGTVATAVFLAMSTPSGFIAAPPLPLHWSPGLPLKLRGPLGRGFRLPADLQRLALVALGETAARLLPLVGLAQNAALALFADCPLPPLPYSLEAFPLKSLPEFLDWADFLAIDLPLQDLSTLRQLLGPPESLRQAGQALLLTPMPCGSLAACGVCAIPTHKGKLLLACEDGPVIDLHDLEW